MKWFLQSENHCRHFVCFLYIFTLQEQFRHLSVFFPAVRSQCIFLAQLRRIPCNPADNLIRCIKQFPGFIFLPILRHKPVTDALIAPFRLLFNELRRYFHIYPRNRQFILVHLVQHLMKQFRIQHPQILFDYAHISLQSLDEISQILHQFILKYQEFLRPHHFFCFHTVQIANVVLVILVQPDKIIVQILPPCINCIQIRPAHFRESRNTAPDPLQKSRFQRRSFDE